jgi:hypothetical protein
VYSCSFAPKIIEWRGLSTYVLSKSYLWVEVRWKERLYVDVVVVVYVEVKV